MNGHGAMSKTCGVINKGYTYHVSQAYDGGVGGGKDCCVVGFDDCCCDGNGEKRR
jgi:hypothetical protein